MKFLSFFLFIFFFDTWVLRAYLHVKGFEIVFQYSDHSDLHVMIRLHLFFYKENSPNTIPEEFFPISNVLSSFLFSLSSFYFSSSPAPFQTDEILLFSSLISAERTGEKKKNNLICLLFLVIKPGLHELRSFNQWEELMSNI